MLTFSSSCRGCVLSIPSAGHDLRILPARTRTSLVTKIIVALLGALAFQEAQQNYKKDNGPQKSRNDVTEYRSSTLVPETRITR